MTNQTTTTPSPAPETPAQPKAPRQRRSFSVRLDDPSGACLRVYARVKKTGAETFVVHSVQDGKKRKNTRGATSEHPDLKAAQAAVDKLVAQAVKQGWSVAPARAGFTRKPDAFAADALPKPAKSSKK